MKRSIFILCGITGVLFAACVSSGLPDHEFPGETPAGEEDSSAEGPAGKEDASTEGPAEEGEPVPHTGSVTRGEGLEAKDDELEYFAEESDGSEAAIGGAPGASPPGSRSSTLTSAPARGIPSTSGLKAGFADDNRQYGYFLNFLDEYADLPHYLLDVKERIILHIRDSEGKPVANAEVSVETGRRKIIQGVTLADGTYQFNPSSDSSSSLYSATISADAGTAQIEFDRNGMRNVSVDLQGRRIIPERVPLDIVFVLDTTGSMGEEIQRLRATIELIHLNLTNLSTNPAVRFGMVLYKDSGDEYDTKVVALTDSLDSFTASLDLVEASGGGDTPEDLQSALEDTLRKMDWNRDGIRLGFIITDAPPHLDYGQQYTYAHAAMEARRRGIKLFSVGTGGLPLSGEYVLRQIAQYTGGKYIFLTYGESGESEGGVPGSVSHHTGANYQTDKLEAIIIRFAKEELSHLTDEPFEEDDPYFRAVRITTEEREETLSKLFTMALDQLSDYSTYPLGKEVTAAILPVEPATEALGLNAEYFTEQMMLAVREDNKLTLVDRANIEDVMNELKLQLSGITDSRTVAEVGRLLNAQVLIAGKLYMPDHYELFFRLLRVETGEVLSVTKAVIDNELGLTGR